MLRILLNEIKLWTKQMKNTERKMFLKWYLLEYVTQQKFWNKLFCSIRNMYILHVQQITFHFVFIQKKISDGWEFPRKGKTPGGICLTFPVPVPSPTHCQARCAQWQRLSGSREVCDRLWQPQPDARLQGTHAKRHVDMACSQQKHGASSW